MRWLRILSALVLAVVSLAWERESDVAVSSQEFGQSQVIIMIIIKTR